MIGVRRSYIYFVRDTTTGNIKIGRSCNPEDRLKALQTCSASGYELLSVLRETTKLTERGLHKRFAAQQVQGEWFRPNDELTAVINAGSTARPVPSLSTPTQAVQFRAEEDRRQQQIDRRRRQIEAFAAFWTILDSCTLPIPRVRHETPFWIRHYPRKCPQGHMDDRCFDSFCGVCGGQFREMPAEERVQWLQNAVEGECKFETTIFVPTGVTYKIGDWGPPRDRIVDETAFSMRFADDRAKKIAAAAVRRAHDFHWIPSPPLDYYETPWHPNARNVLPHVDHEPSWYRWPLLDVTGDDEEDRDLSCDVHGVAKFVCAVWEAIAKQYDIVVFNKPIGGVI